MSPVPSDRAESIRHRLRNRMRAQGEDAQFGLRRYAAERFLFRLGESTHRESFILKGAMLFAIWGEATYRSTRDIDFAGFGSADPVEKLHAMVVIGESNSRYKDFHDVYIIATQWRAYLTRNHVPGVPEEIEVVGELLRLFLNPPWQALAARTAFNAAWPKHGPWEAAP